MYYENIQKGRFISRPNRFVAHVELNGEEVVCHVKNTGRCKELLYPGAPVYVQEHDNPKRKTKYSLIGVEKQGIMINMDSQAPNQAAQEWIASGGLFPEPSLIKREKTYGKSRFDLYVEYGDRKVFMEVKGVTLEDGGIARFPDAPTERGLKHVEELIQCREAGYEAYLLFVIQMKGIRHFEPNWITQPVLGEALIRAQKHGVQLLAMDCIVTPDTLTIDAPVPIQLQPDAE